MAENATTTMVRAWIDAVLTPAIKKFAHDDVQLARIGGILIGYGVTLLRKVGSSDDAIRETFEGAMGRGKPADN
jgi:hypothetical protein